MTVLDAQAELWNEEHRQALSRRVIAEADVPGITISETEGYILLPKGSVAGYEAFQSRVRRLFKERLQSDGSIVRMSYDGSKKNPKRYMQSVLCAEDYAHYPELLSLGLNRHVLAAVSRYLGTLPVLRTVDVFWTPPPDGSEHKGSQRFHFDHDDYREVKLFFYIEDVDERGGPFTFLPKTLSDEVAAKATPFRGESYTDEDVHRVCPPELSVKFVGPAGTGVIVDTSNCLHFGGRVDHRGRLMAMHQYLRPQSNVIMHARTNLDAIVGLELDDLGRHVIAVPPWAKLPEAAVS
jgi:hypothetical protein